MGWFSNFFGGSTKKEPTSSSGSSQPNSPQSQSIKESNEAIQDLVDNKDKYQNNLIAGDNRNEYQMRMQALKTGQTFDPSKVTFTDRKGNQIDPGSDNKTIGNAGGAEAYKKRFPITSGIQNLAGAASNLIPGVGMAKGILKVLGNFGKGTKNVFNQAVTGITDSNAYNDFKNLVTKDEKLPTDMGTRMSSMDQADADAATLNMADISGPSMSTDIIEIKDKKVKTKNNLDKINNAQKTLNEALDIQNFRRILDNPSAIETLPINFKSTVDTLLQNNQLNSGDYLKSQQLLRDKGTPVGPFINGYNNAGIINALPNNNQVATNLFNNFTPTLESISNFNESLSDGKGFDVNLKDQTFEYNKPMLGGNLNFGIDNSSSSPTFGINFSKSLG